MGMGVKQGPGGLQDKTKENRMPLDTFTQHMPILKGSQFWPNYMSALRGPLNAEDVVRAPSRELSIWKEYRPVDITMCDLIYGSPSSSSALNQYHTYKPIHTSIYGMSRNRLARY